ncbi:hypothetical protein HMPREF3200_00739 [Anaerococcus tetradius]|uniref:Uncharacterized protein n=1 Tax=Anaerococcus tetradius TaxID=33036 RepID=A0A133KFV9_9FIRM|nr:hypothetical protein HMPREF3200_00739 [Anaerococcus tetradius]
MDKLVFTSFHHLSSKQFDCMKIFPAYMSKSILKAKYSKKI